MAGRSPFATPSSRAEDAAFIAEKLLAELKLPFKIAGMDFFTTVSVGIALYPDDGENAELPIRKADIAMYLIKGAARTATSSSPKQMPIRRSYATLPPDAGRDLCLTDFLAGK